jgi:hypothetical protein
MDVGFWKWHQGRRERVRASVKHLFRSLLQGRTGKGTNTETKQRASHVKWLLAASPVNTTVATKLHVVLPKKDTNAK